MKKLSTILLSTLCCFSCAESPSVQSSNQQYEPTWESLSQHQEAPEWLQDAKLGMYFHWGVYTVPAYSSEWYPFYIYRPGTDVYKYHQTTYGADFQYHDFVDQFTGENFDAAEWAQLFKSTGARFAGPCALHHDGFAMWDSDVTPWNSADRGPKKDITGELTKELKKIGLKTITTFHHARNFQRNANSPEEWASSGDQTCGYNSHFAYDPTLVTASDDPELQMMYGNVPEDQFMEYWFNIIKEVADKYSPDMIWFDSWLNLIPEDILQKMVAYYYNQAHEKGQDVTIGFKQADLPLEVGILDIEQGGKTDISERVWMTDITLSTRSWSYIEGQTYKDSEIILRNMIDVWSKNGVVLLNISPTSHGVIPDAQREVLKPIGEWLAKYGEAVYETRPFIKYGFGSAAATSGPHGGQAATATYSAKDVRYTLAKDKSALYVTFLGRPTPGDVIMLSDLAPHRYPAPGKVKRVTLLGSDVEATFVYGTNRCSLTIPDAPMDEIATVFKFELE